MNSPSVTESRPNLLIRLWRNQEYRSVFFQILTMVIVFALLGMIVSNVATNLKNVGKDFSFSFLGSTAGYDITFQPFIPFSPTDTHLRAAVVGVLTPC